MRLIRNITFIGLAGSALAAGGLGIGALTAAPAAVAAQVVNPTAVEYAGPAVVNPTAVEYGGPAVVNPTAVEYGAISGR
jgi:hypothetical protein